MQYHPDRVAHLGPKLREVAEHEMKEINEAYDFFRRKYGFS
jgi:DnaJ like chaperone protein